MSEVYIWRNLRYTDDTSCYITIIDKWDNMAVSIITDFLSSKYIENLVMKSKKFAQPHKFQPLKYSS